MDIADRYEQDRAFLEKVYKPNLKKEAEPTGYCLFCGEPIHVKGRRWCDADCRDAWQKEKNRKHRK